MKVKRAVIVYFLQESREDRLFERETQLARLRPNISARYTATQNNRQYVHDIESVPDSSAYDREVEAAGTL